MKHFLVSVIFGLSMIQNAPAQTNSDEYDAPELLAETKKIGRASRAYHAEALRRLLAEANYYADRLKLPTPHPIQLSDLKFIYVGAPLFSTLEPWMENREIIERNVPAQIARINSVRFVATGTIETTNFVFAFFRGKTWNIINKRENIESYELYPEWEKTPSLIDTNGAYQLATQWLASIDIDVDALKKKYGSPKIEQTFCHPDNALMPIFRVMWGEEKDSEYPVSVRILGTKKEVMSVVLCDLSLSRRPLMIIPNARELNAIPNPQKKQLSAPQTDSIKTPSSDAK